MLMDTLPKGAIRGAGTLEDPLIWANPPKRFFDAPTQQEIADFFAEGAQDAIHVTAEGRVMHRLTPQAACHLGYMGTCVSPPAIQAAYAHFNTDLGSVVTAEGEIITAGPLSGDIGHSHGAPTPAEIKAHYNGTADWSENGKGRRTGLPAWRGHTTATSDNTGAVIASVRYNVVGNDIWGTGALSPHVDSVRVASIRAGGASGDWLELQRGKGMILLGSVMVPSPGMRGISRKLAPIRRMRSGSTEFDFNIAQIQSCACEVGKADCGCDEGMTADAYIVDDVDTTTPPPSGLLFDATGQAVSPMSPLDSTRAILALHAALRDMAGRFDEVVGVISSQLSEQGTAIAGLLPQITASAEAETEKLDEVEPTEVIEAETPEAVQADGGEYAEPCEPSGEVLHAEPFKPTVFEHNEIVTLPSGIKAVACGTYSYFSAPAEMGVIVRPQLPDGTLVDHKDAMIVSASSVGRTGYRAAYGDGGYRTVLKADGSVDLEEIDIEAEKLAAAAAEVEAAAALEAELNAKLAALMTADFLDA